MALTSGCVCGSCPDGLCVDCVRGGQLCIPNDPEKRTPRMLSEIGVDISKTRGLGGENKPVLPADANFDGAAVKQNWIPLVVLGLSLVVGIGISEWATKKYIK